MKTLTKRENIKYCILRPSKWLLLVLAFSPVFLFSQDKIFEAEINQSAAVQMWVLTDAINTVGEKNLRKVKTDGYSSMEEYILSKSQAIFNEPATVYVSSKSKDGKEDYKKFDSGKIYFQHYKSLNYDSIRISFYENGVIGQIDNEIWLDKTFPIQFVENESIEGVRNVYKTIRRYKQLFTGYKKGEITYQDITIKEVELKIVDDSSGRSVKIETITVKKTTRIR